MHHILNPHFLGATLLPGIPNLILLIFLAVAIWYLLGKRKQPAKSPKGTDQAVDSDNSLERKNEELQIELLRLRRENELLQKLLEKELKK